MLFHIALSQAKQRQFLSTFGKIPDRFAILLYGENVSLTYAPFDFAYNADCDNKASDWRAITDYGH